MKKLFIAICAIFISMGAYAQHTISSPSSDLKVKVSRCASTGSIVTIDLVLTNIGKDKNINICGSDRGSMAYDDEGNVYNNRILVGLPSQRMDEWSEFMLPTDIPVKFKVQISNVDTNASKITLLNLKMGIYSEIQGIIKIKNLNIEKN